MLTAPPPNCATGTLDPYIPSPGQPWDRTRALHLHRRLGFSARPATIDQALASNPVDWVNQVLDQAAAAPNLAQPPWHDWTIDDYGDDFAAVANQQQVEYAQQWASAMLENGAKEKISLFWHNHFVTRAEDYFCPSYLHNYIQTLQTHGLGNFRTMVYEIGKTPAMLIYLNGVQNTRINPNENYARELFELFTLGRDNGYTQNDIVEAARALTGWNGFTSACAPIGYVPFLHDPGAKTIFGQTGNWGYDQLHDILFTRRAQEIATYICGKIYRHFVHPLAPDEIVAQLAQTLIDNDWELLPVFRQLFTSAHFFDSEVIGVLIKSPLDMMLGNYQELDVPFNQDILNALLFGAYQLGQSLFNPVDVAGWPGDRTWINTSTITGRWQYSDFILFTIYQNVPELLRQLAQRLTTDAANDPALVAESLTEYIVPRALTSPEAYDRVTMVLKWEVPQNYYDNGEWNLYWETVPAQVALCLQHLSRLPEFQLT